ncbi:MAG: sugar ABC transporter substrate-binding protein [Trueperaceae bacterium]|nr:MAG: sugar ABC transporter substrate-binding protein [Trueperaceae bacterium]
MGNRINFVLVVLLLGGFALAQVDVRLWHMEQPPHRVDRVQELIDAFNAANPDIEVVQEVQNWGDVIPKALSAVRARVQPDILFAIPDFTLTMKATGAVQPVTELANNLHQQHGFLDAAIDPYSYQDEVWAVPLYGMVQSLWYRKDVLAEAGIEPPTTWEELLAAAEALTTEDRYGIGIPGSKSLYADQVIYNFMITAGAKTIFNDDGSIRFDTPETVRAFQYYHDLFQFSPPDSVSWIWGDAEAAFASGRVPMIIQFTTITTFDQQTEDLPANLGVVPIPAPAELGERGNIYYSNGAMVLTGDPAKKAAAEKFLAYLLEPDNYGRFLNMEPALFLPVTADGQEAESFWNDPLVVEYEDQVRTMVDNSAYGALFGFTTGQVFDGIGPISAQNLLSQVVQRVLVDGDSPEDAVTWGQAQMEAATR